MHLQSSRRKDEVRGFIEEAASLRLNPIAENSFRRVRRVGAGTFSIVSEAYFHSGDARSPRVVALKELRSDKHSFERQSGQLLTEASVLARLDHEFVIQYIGCGVSTQSGAPSVFMAQEFLSGGSLHEYICRLRRRRVTYDPRYSYSLATALRWALQVSSAVAYLHTPEVAIVHRDIKLGNLLLTDRHVERSDVKLADFGLSVDARWMKPIKKANVQIAQWKLQALSYQKRKMLRECLASTPSCKMLVNNPCAPWKGKRRASFTDAELATGKEAVYYDLTEETGSYMYMSPEVWLGLPYNEKADIYSLGIIIAELLTGRPLSSCLLPEKSYEEAKNFSYCVANGLRLRCPKHFPKKLSSLLESCWDPDPVKRPTAAHVHESIQSYIESLKNAHKMPLFHPMALTSMQRFRLNIARMRYLPQY